MKPLWTVFALILLFLTGCSSNTSNNAMDGESIYNKSCVACHGDKLQGAVGPTLLNLKIKYSEADVLKIVTNGTRQMPANLLSEKDAKVVTKWLMGK